MGCAPHGMRCSVPIGFVYLVSPRSEVEPGMSWGRCASGIFETCTLQPILQASGQMHMLQRYAVGTIRVSLSTLVRCWPLEATAMVS